MRKVVIVVVAILAVLGIRQNAVHAYTITPADTVVTACIGDVVDCPEYPTPSPSVSVTPSPSPTPVVGGRFSLFGYTSPLAQVSVTNPGLYSDTTADSTGYFEFHNFFSRLLIEDICLTAQDQSGRVTMPVCIPPIPNTENQSIGPILMPPTISLNNDSFYSGDTVVIAGQTTPKSDIELSLFTDESKTVASGNGQRSISFFERLNYALFSATTRLNPVKPSYASTKPKQSIKTDSQGYFSLTLPSSDPLYYRTFAQTIFRKDFSLKSITLNFNIFPGWFLIMKWILGFLGGLKHRLPEIIILSQIILILYLILRHYLRPHTIARMRALAILEHPLPVLTQHELLISAHELALQQLLDEKKALKQTSDK